jgi:hypothetical protein
MANLYVLEGMGESFSGRRRKEFRVHRGNRTSRMAGCRVPGIIEGGQAELLGRSLFSKIGSVAKSVAKVAVAPVTVTYSVAKSAGKATVNAVEHPSLTAVSKIVTNPAVRAANAVKDTGKEAVHAVAETGRAADTAASRTLDVTRRVAKRLIKTVAKKVLFHGVGLLGASAVAAVPKNAAKGVLIPVATAAVLANTVTAPAAPVVPVLANEVIDELYNSISDKIAKGLSPDKAAAEAQADLDKLEPGEENDPKVGGGFGPILLIGGAGLLALLLLRRK